MTERITSHLVAVWLCACAHLRLYLTDKLGTIHTESALCFVCFRADLMVMYWRFEHEHVLVRIYCVFFEVKKR